MRVSVFNTRSAGLAAAVRRLGRRVGAAFGLRAARVNVVFVNNRTITDLNRRFLGRNRPTDVLAFPSPPAPAEIRPTESLLGEVYVSRDQARIQTRAFGATCRGELLRLVLHGLLHLAGLSHREMPRHESHFLPER